MTAESLTAVMPDKIKDEFGHGHFEVITTNLREGEKVPAFNNVHGLHSISLDREFPKREFAEGKLVAAYRCSERGMCSVLINPALLEVDEMDRHFTDFWRKDRQVVLEVQESDFYRLQHLEGGRTGNNALVISGRRKDSGQKITVVVQFFPSSDEDWAKARK